MRLNASFVAQAVLPTAAVPPDTSVGAPMQLEVDTEVTKIEQETTRGQPIIKVLEGDYAGKHFTLARHEYFMFISE